MELQRSVADLAKALELSMNEVKPYNEQAAREKSRSQSHRGPRVGSYIGTVTVPVAQPERAKDDNHAREAFAPKTATARVSPRRYQESSRKASLQKPKKKPPVPPSNMSKSSASISTTSTTNTTTSTTNTTTNTTQSNEVSSTLESMKAGKKSRSHIVRRVSRSVVDPPEARNLSSTAPVSREKSPTPSPRGAFSSFKEGDTSLSNHNTTTTNGDSSHNKSANIQAIQATLIRSLSQSALQKSPGGTTNAPYTAPAPTPAPVPLDTRGKIAKEIYETEKTYCNNLQIIVNEFEYPLREESVTKSSYLDTIFSNIEMIADLHAPILSQLADVVNHWNAQSCMGTIFITIVNEFAMYKQYCANYHQGLMCLEDRIQSSSKFAAFMQSKKETGLDLSSLLIQPVQRIPRYRLLFAELLKHTPTDHPDYKSVTAALLKIEEIAVCVNESIREKDNQDKLRQIEESLTGKQVPTVVAPQRKFVKEGILVKMCRREPKRRYFFLFNDMLIYGVASNLTEQSKTTYTVHRTLDLAQVHVEDLPEKDGELGNAFQLLSNQKSFAVFAESKEEKDNWIKAFQLAKQLFAQMKDQENANNADGIAPVWVPDKLLKTCMLCPTKFTTLTRRHHCRKCGKLVCGACSSRKYKLPNMGGKMCRVCDECYDDFVGASTARPASRNSPVMEQDDKRVSKAKMNLAKIATLKFKDPAKQPKPTGVTALFPGQNQYSSLVPVEGKAPEQQQQQQAGAGGEGTEDAPASPDSSSGSDSNHSSPSVSAKDSRKRSDSPKKHRPSRPARPDRPPRKKHSTSSSASHSDEKMIGMPARPPPRVPDESTNSPLLSRRLSDDEEEEWALPPPINEQGYFVTHEGTGTSGELELPPTPSRLPPPPPKH